MNILYLGYFDSEIPQGLRSTGEKVLEYDREVALESLKALKPDMVISYGYRFIFRQEFIDFMKGQIINLHISLLPWNRGADPNLWSWIEDTPKGVTIHFVDAGVDNGPVIAQREMTFIRSPKLTFRHTYRELRKAMEQVFFNVWPSIKKGNVVGITQRGEGSFHYSKDKEIYMPLMKEKGWDTPIDEFIQGMRKVVLENGEAS